MHLEDGWLLELAADAEIGNRSLVELGEINRPVEQNIAIIGLGLAGDDIHHRRFTGAIRPDNRTHFAGFDRQRKAVDRLKPVKGDADAIEVKEIIRNLLVHGSYSAGCMEALSAAFSRRLSCHAP